MTTTRQPLGRGLGALLPPPQYAQTRDDYLLCALDRIRPDPHQPRQHFDPTALEELVQSVREKGIIQPLVVRPDGSAQTEIAPSLTVGITSAPATGIDHSAAGSPLTTNRTFASTVRTTPSD